MVRDDGKCPTCGEQGVMAEVRGVYDGGLFWMCLAEDHAPWHRWPEGNSLHEKAERVWALWDANRDTSGPGSDDTGPSTKDAG